MSARRRIRTPGGGSVGDVSVVAPSAVDQKADLGNADDSISSIGGEFSQHLGTNDNSIDIGDFSLIVPLGNAGDFLQGDDATGSNILDVGDVSALLAAATTGTNGPASLGATTQGSFSASAELEGQQHAASSSQVGLDWTNISNAEGQDSGTYAEIAASNSTTSGDSYDSDLFLSPYGGGLTPDPAGYTRTSVDLLVHHAYKVNINPADLLSALAHSIQVLDSLGQPVGPGTPAASWDDDDADMETPATDVFPLTNAEFDNMNQVRFAADCTLAIGGATTSSVYWRVYWVAVRINYTRTGIQ